MTERALLFAGALALVACGDDNGGANNTTTPDPTGIDPTSATESGTETSMTTGMSATMTTMSGATEADSSSGDDPNCGEVDFVLEAIPPNVMLVLDKSGSMVDADNDWDHDNNPGTPPQLRWRSLHDVVTFVVESFDDKINFGANLFPSEAAQAQLGSAACTVRNNVEVEVSGMNAQAVLDGIPAANATATDIQGATPATEGVRVALDHLLTLDPEVDRFMILVTDGAANCGDEANTSMCPGAGCGLMEEYDTLLPQVVGSAFDDDEVPTFVIGIDIQDALQGDDPMDGQPEANTFVELNAVAEAGGRSLGGDEKFFNATNEAELMSALEEIAGQVVSCTVPLGEDPEHPNFVEIEIGGMTFDRVDDCATEDGWVYTNPEGPFDTIELCGAACESLAAAGELDATFGCPPPG